MSLRTAAMGIALAGAFVAAGCGGSRAPDLVLITLDTVRADRLGCYGHKGGLTPNVDRLAARSVLFEDASAAVPITLPSHATLFTGRYPTSTGVRNNGTFVLPEGETTLAERLRERGWKTGAVVAAYPLQSRYGLAQGFDIYDEELPRTFSRGQPLPVHFNERDARAVTDRALEVWKRLAGGRRFLWVHYFDAHAPYAAPDPFGAAHREAPYEGEIAFVDAELGRLLAAIAHDAPDAWIVVTADHGEGLGEHGEKTHGVFLYESTLRVPLVIRAPGRWPEGRRVTAPVTLADVVPTLLSLAGMPAATGLDGENLAPLLEGATPGRDVYAESYLPLLEFRFSPLTMIRDGALKYIDAPVPELYDVRADPAESRNLADARADTKALAARLAALAARADPDASERASGGLDAEAEARL
ncbi:MAG TPA: sulfatase, partial [Candidatus Polarisedimenticolaceae bacterium]|nr:sulfatase [Candidatus Polarisedimenticolaceae bacterium]